MAIKLSLDVIFRRLGKRPHDADYELVACDKCGYPYLADHESLTIYLDPSLGDSVLNAEGEQWPPCRGCGAKSRDMVPVSTPSKDWEWTVEVCG